MHACVEAPGESTSPDHHGKGLACIHAAGTQKDAADPTLETFPYARVLSTCIVAPCPRDLMSPNGCQGNMRKMADNVPASPIDLARFDTLQELLTSSHHVRRQARNGRPARLWLLLRCRRNARGDTRASLATVDPNRRGSPLPPQRRRRRRTRRQGLRMGACRVCGVTAELASGQGRHYPTVAALQRRRQRRRPQRRSAVSGSAPTRRRSRAASRQHGATLGREETGSGARSRL
eukprot:167997-Chlamydomonas_euryale.AAC.4